MKAIWRLAIGVALAASMLAATVGPAHSADPAFSDAADSTWMTNGVGKVFSIDTGGNRAFFGGSFTGMRATFNGATTDQKYVAAIDMWTGDLVAAFDPVVSDEVRAVGVSPDGATVYIGGRFTTVNGQTRTKIAALNAANGNLRAGFDVTIPVGNVDAISVKSNGDVFIGGNFTTINGQGQRAVALLDGDSGALKNFAADVPVGKVVSLHLTANEDRLYAGTSIDEEGDPTFGDLYAFNPNNGNDISGFSADTVDKPVLDIAATGSKIYLAQGGAGGAAEVLRVSDGSRRRLYGADGDVQAVEVIGDRAYFAGHWTTNFGGVESFHFIAVDVDDDSNIDDSYYPRLNGPNGIHDLHYDGFHFWMGGHILDGNPVARKGFARYSPLGSANLTPIIGAGAEWAYRDDGATLGTAWRKRTFNDNSWERGPAELGYGDGDEATVVDSGPGNNRHITTYFRRGFTVYNHNAVGTLELRLRRDDGVRIFINEAEVVRDNLPSGFVNGNTLALTPINGAAESVWTRWILSPNVLREGENIIAVEIHQESPSSNDITFDLELLVDTTPKAFIKSGATWRYRDDGPSLGTGWRKRSFDDTGWRKGRSQLGYGEGDETKTIRKGPAGDHHITSYFRRVFSVYDLAAVDSLELELLRDDGAVVYVNNVEVARSNMPNGPINSETTAKRPMHKPAEQRWYRYSIDPGLLVVGDNVIAVEIHQIGPASPDHSFDARLLLSASPQRFIAPGSKWRYHDRGVDKGTKWRKRNYAHHSNWQLGRAELGYGDGDEAKVIRSGPPGDRHPTSYFRKKFVVTDPGVFSELDIELIRDDGAVIYINGVEVVRNNMPSGPIRFETLASGSASGEDQWQSFTVDASVLVAGVNVVAVEIHQASPSSSDLSFNLELTGR